MQRLEDQVGGKQKLEDCTGYMDWPSRGVYFFFAPDETRENTSQLRVTRVGTHAVSQGSSTSLWDRLKQHYGTGSRSQNHPHGGNHRGSVYRKRVGEAIIHRDDVQDQYPSWNQRWSSIDRERDTVRDEEYSLEKKVSSFIRRKPLLWIRVDDEPSKNSERGFIERNTIALLSNYEKETLDPRSSTWLGKHSPKQEIRESGLWNVNHVEENYDSEFLDLLEEKVAQTTTEP
nr:hypothetical protein [Haloarcula argentinensis]